MRGSSIRSRITYANVASTLALVIALGTGTAYAAVIITSNSQVAKDTISGHKPPTGAHSNIISGSINATDLANGSVGAAKLQAPEAWHEVAPGARASGDRCNDTTLIAVFCNPGGAGLWANFGGGFATAGFYKDQLGIVHLKGLITSETTYTSDTPQVALIFRLPAAYAPAHQLVFPSVGRNASGQELAQSRVDVRTNGEVVFEQDCQASSVFCSSSGGYLSLDGISYRLNQ